MECDQTNPVHNVIIRNVFEDKLVFIFMLCATVIDAIVDFKMPFFD